MRLRFRVMGGKIETAGEEKIEDMNGNAKEGGGNEAYGGYKMESELDGNVKKWKRGTL